MTASVHPRTGPTAEELGVGTTPERGAMLERRPFGKTGLLAPQLCIGTSAIGSIPQIYGYGVETGQALATLRAVFAGPIRFIDTSNSYGQGEAERRIGTVLREIGGLPADFLLSTKVDPDASLDFSGSGCGPRWTKAPNGSA